MSNCQALPCGLEPVDYQSGRTGDAWLAFVLAARSCGILELSVHEARQLADVSVALDKALARSE